MYSQRITEWGLKKNRSAADRQGNQRIVRKHEARGEERPETLSNNRSSNVPRLVGSENIGAVIQSPQRKSTFNIRPGRTMPSPTRLRWVEMIIHQANVFYEVDVHTRISQNMQNSVEIILPGAEPITVYPTDFINAFQGAIEAIVGGQPKIGWRQLNESLDMLTPLFKSRSSYVISELLDCASEWPHEAPPEISRAVWRHVADMAATVLGKNDPTAMICNALTHLESRDEIYEATQNSLRLILKKFEKYLGQDTPPAMTTKAKYTRLLVQHGQLDEAENLQMEVVQQRQRVYGSGQNVTLAIYRLAVLLRQKKDFEGAERVFLDALQRSRAEVEDDLKDRNTGTVNVALSMFIVMDRIAALKEAGREDLVLSQSLLEEALSRCCKHCEYFDDWKKCGPYLVDCLPVIVDVLRRQGKLAAVDALKTRFSDYISTN